MLADILGYVIKNPTQISTLSVDIVRSCEYSYTQNVTSHPVENGFEIHDSISNKPLSVTMTVGVSSSPVTWFWRNGSGQSKFSNALSALEAIRDAKEPVTIIRPDKIMENMVLTDIRYANNEDTKSVIWVDLAFQQIFKVATQVVDIPEDIVDASVKESAGETAADGGAASQTDADNELDADGSEEKQSKSWLSDFIDSWFKKKEGKK